MIAEEKFVKLKAILREMGNVIIAYSGGVDSTFLVKAAKDTLGEKALAVIGTSPTYPQKEFKEAKDYAREIGMRYVVIEIEEIRDPSFSSNTRERCYYCKKRLFSKIKERAMKEGIQFILDGTNSDDKRDFRPGRKASQELNVRSPLLEAGLSKEEIRKLSRGLKLPTWDKPAQACLSSRVPYGEEITGEKLKRIEEGEEFIRSLGFRQVRLRHHGKLARIEVDKEDIQRFFKDSVREKITDKLLNLGYTYVTLDLEGYCTGSLNK